VYRYKGPYCDPAVVSSANRNQQDFGSSDSGLANGHAGPIFDEFFALQYEKSLFSGQELLCKDFCLFTKDGSKLILASAASASTSTEESSSSARKFPNSLTWIGGLDDVTFWVLDTATGDVLGKRTYKNDYIYLNNHSGVHLYEDYLAIASVQNQCIYLCYIKVRLTLIVCNVKRVLLTIRATLRMTVR
jgi:hypothetical protein